MKQNIFFIIYKRLSMKQIMQFLLESESPIKGNISVYMILMTIIHFGINVEPTLQLSTVKLILMSRYLCLGL